MFTATGDDFSVFLNLVSNKTHDYNTFYIVGNHEKKINNQQVKDLFKELEKMNVKILDN